MVYAGTMASFLASGCIDIPDVSTVSGKIKDNEYNIFEIKEMRIRQSKSTDCVILTDKGVLYTDNEDICKKIKVGEKYPLYIDGIHDDITLDDSFKLICLKYPRVTDVLI